ncbi:ubiquitin carboxyl-hydrolase [Actinomyces sp. Marseille-P3109]|uniref:ubiquitin carboxyl-hydrolase n=1 Tax=Actinomyces sp. Marseille-P3109 TaxID=2083009 RepID=UPI000D553EB0|nr:ubiquitin carboxyl-hydrolase [Actinomyces sp. Marseille-P3109]
MRNLIRRVGRGRVIATAVVVVTAGLLVGVTRMVFFHPTESASEPGIVLNGTPGETSSQSSTSVSPGQVGGASSTQYEQHDVEAESSGAPGHSPQQVEPEPPVAVDHGVRQVAPAAPAVPATNERSGNGNSNVSDDDDDAKGSVPDVDTDDHDNDIDD